MQLVGALMPLLGGLICMYLSYSLDLGRLMKPGPGLWPFIASAAIVCGSAILLLRGHHLHDTEEFTPRVKYVAYGLASLLIFISLFMSVGFTLPGFLLLAFWLRVLGKENWVVTVSVSLITTLCFQFLFASLLGIPFPEDAILSILQ